MKSYDVWKIEIENYIQKLKLKQKKYAYYPSCEMSADTKSRLEIYFSALGYDTEFRQCNQCKPPKFDVTIGNF